MILSIRRNTGIHRPNITMSISICDNISVHTKTNISISISTVFNTGIKINIHMNVNTFIGGNIIYLNTDTSKNY